MSKTKLVDYGVGADCHFLKWMSILLQCVDWTLFSLSRGGVILGDSDTVGECSVTVLHAHPLLKGGKGGEDFCARIHYMDYMAVMLF